MSIYTKKFVLLDLIQIEDMSVIDAQKCLLKCMTGQCGQEAAALTKKSLKDQMDAFQKEAPSSSYAIIPLPLEQPQPAAPLEQAQPAPPVEQAQPAPPVEQAQTAALLPESQPPPPAHILEPTPSALQPHTTSSVPPPVDYPQFFPSAVKYPPVFHYLQPVPPPVPYHQPYLSNVNYSVPHPPPAHYHQLTPSATNVYQHPPGQSTTRTTTFIKLFSMENVSG